jgi:predicted ArsR family transcriptional regulator
MSLDAVAVLAEPVRRAVYEAVLATEEPIGRDDVAEALGIGRTLAAFHLDKLAAAGLLDISYARRTGRTGPGAGRPAKLYRRSAAEYEVHVPPRDYRALAQLLADAVEETGAEAALQDAARRRGAEVAAAVDTDRSVAGLIDLLTALGYAPIRDGNTLRLRNCPFETVARSHPPVVCGANLALIEGALAQAGFHGMTARLDPGPTGCCVVVDEQPSCKNNDR